MQLSIQRDLCCCTGGSRINRDNKMSAKTEFTTERFSPRLSYKRGLHYRKELIAAAPAIQCDECRTYLKDAVRLLPLSTIDPHFHIADALARKYRIDRKQIREDCYFAAAVDTIARYCGDEARGLIFQGNRFLDRKTVLQISRTAPTRQQYEIEQVRKGRRPLDTKGKGCPVYDTVDFKEILSRLRRAQGKIAECLVALPRLSGTKPSQEELIRLTVRLESIRSATVEVMRLVDDAPDGDPCPCDLAREPKSPAKTAKKARRSLPTGFHRIIGLLNQAGSWSNKCARDLPQLLQQVWPIRREKREIRLRGESLIGVVEKLLRYLGQA